MQENDAPKPLTPEQVKQLQEWAKRQEAKREGYCPHCLHCNSIS